MTDHFALLNEPRRPWLDVEQLKARFLARSAECHPDRASTPKERETATARFAELNAAHNCLREPRERLQHLLALEGRADARQVRSVPAGVAELVLPAEQLCRDVTAFLAERARAASPLVQAQLFARALEWQESVAAMQQRLGEYRARLDETARALNADWEKADALTGQERAAALPLAPLEELYRAYSYVTRFQQQLQERFVQLAV